MRRTDSHKITAFSLQLVLIIPFALQIFGAMDLVGYLSFKNGREVVNDLADQLMNPLYPHTLIPLHPCLNPVSP